MNDNEAKALFRQAADVYKDGDYKDALKIFDRLDAAFPNNERIMFPRARCFAKMGRTDEAVAICDLLITQYGHESAATLRVQLVSGEFPVLGGPPGLEDTAFDPLDLNVDEKLASVFERPVAAAQTRRFPMPLVLVLVALAILLIGIPLILGGGGDSSDDSPPPESAVPDASAGDPSRVQEQSDDSSSDAP